MAMNNNVNMFVLALVSIGTIVHGATQCSLSTTPGEAATIYNFSCTNVCSYWVLYILDYPAPLSGCRYTLPCRVDTVSFSDLAKVTRSELQAVTNGKDPKSSSAISINVTRGNLMMVAQCVNNSTYNDGVMVRVVDTSQKSTSATLPALLSPSSTISWSASTTTSLSTYITMPLSTYITMPLTPSNTMPLSTSSTICTSPSPSITTLLSSSTFIPESTSTTLFLQPSFSTMSYEESPAASLPAYQNSPTDSMTMAQVTTMPSDGSDMMQ